MDNKFEHNGYFYNIFEEYIASDIEQLNDYEIVETDKTIIKNIFLICPVYKKGKFRWFKKTRLKYRLLFYRKSIFDDGWSYQFYWSKWIPKWELIDILD